MSKDARIYLAHVLERIQRIERYTTGGKEHSSRIPSSKMR